MSAITSPWRGATTSGLPVPRSMAATWARSSTAWGTSTGNPIDMTKSMFARPSQKAAMVSMSAVVARRRSEVSGSRT